MKLTFKNVGQGDSIIIEWNKGSKRCFGIIDCNIFQGRNPTLDFLIANNVLEIEFIVLSHFHLDHFSGMAEIFQYCIDKKVKVKHFYHSLAPFLVEIFGRIFTSQRIQLAISEFFKKYDAFETFLEDAVPVSNHLSPVELTNFLFMSFLAPKGKLYHAMARQLARKVAKITSTAADFNKLSTIIMIEKRDTNECLIITSDAVKKAFKGIKVSNTAVLVQAPHHGSWPSIDTRFWTNLKRIPLCPAVFSVGDVPRDRLPNTETVAFFDTQNYDVKATNTVYGIKDYFFNSSTPSISPSATSRSKILNGFSTLRKTSPIVATTNQFNGDQVFNPF